MLPLRLSPIARRQKTCEQSHGPRRFTSTSRVHCSSVSSRNGTMVSMPALFTRMSRPPSSFHALSIIASTSSRFETSPIGRHRLAALRADGRGNLVGGFSSSPTSLTATSAPSSANTSAMPRPIPRPAPVMNAFLPFSRMLFGLGESASSSALASETWAAPHVRNV